MAFIKVSIIGDGSEGNPFRANIPPALVNDVIARKAVMRTHLPSQANGQPRFSDCFVWVSDHVPIAIYGLAAVNESDALIEMSNRDNRINLDAMRKRGK